MLPWSITSDKTELLSSPASAVWVSSPSREPRELLKQDREENLPHRDSLEPNTNTAPETLSAHGKAENVLIIWAQRHMQAPLKTSIAGHNSDSETCNNSGVLYLCIPARATTFIFLYIINTATCLTTLLINLYIKDLKTKDIHYSQLWDNIKDMRIRGPHIALYSKNKIKTEILLELLKHVNKYLERQLRFPVFFSKESVIMSSLLCCNPSSPWTSLASCTSSSFSSSFHVSVL